jgi:hypothetical protein
MLTHLRQAIALVRATPGRRGHVIDLQNCTEVLVAGDLHGHVAHFQVMLQEANLANHPSRHFVLQELIHGKHRYPQGGDKSHQLVDLFAALKGQFPKQVHFLPGNHELAQWTGRPVMKADENLNAIFREGVIEGYGTEFGSQIYDAYLELFQALPVVLRTPNRVLVCHSLPATRVMGSFDPSRLLVEKYDDVDLQAGGAVHSILWGRDTARENVIAFLKKMDADLLVSGHIASEQGYSIPNDHQVIVDCAESPGGFVIIPADRPITHADLVNGVRII